MLEAAEVVAVVDFLPVCVHKLRIREIQQTTHRVAECRCCERE